MKGFVEAVKELCVACCWVVLYFTVVLIAIPWIGKAIGDVDIMLLGDWYVTYFDWVVGLWRT